MNCENRKIARPKYKKFTLSVKTHINWNKGMENTST
jgi:hypothetical protein